MESFEKIINNYEDFIWEVDKKGHFTYVSYGIENILGYKKSEIIGKKIFHFMQEDESEKIKKYLKQKLLKTDKFKYLKNRHIHKNGNIIIFESSGTTLFDENKNIIGYRGISKNISYQNTLEKSLIKQYKYANHLSHKIKTITTQTDTDLKKQVKFSTMGKMFEKIIHQWRQPLSTICTTSSGLMIQEEHKLLNKQIMHDSLSLIKNTSHYLSDVVEDFRAFYKEENIKRLFNINELFEKTLSLLPSEFKEIQIIKNIEEFELFTYDTLIVQIFMNIFINANDEFTRHKIKNKLLFITVYKDNDSCIIKIKDNAGGIQNNIINKILTSRISTKKDGTGLGLCLCKEILSKHLYGTITVLNKSYKHNKENHMGAEFIITVPINIQTKSH